MFIFRLASGETMETMESFTDPMEDHFLFKRAVGDTITEGILSQG